MADPIYKPTKPYSADVNDLIAADEFILKGRALPIGTVRNWSGTSYVKEQDGWKPVAHQKNERPVEDTKPSASAQPEPSGKDQSPSQKESSEVNEAEKSALKEYQSGVYNSALGGYVNLQGYLRDGKPKFGKFTPEETKLADQVISNVSSAISKHPIDKPMTVYRGVTVNKDQPGSKVYADLKEGDTFSDKGFTSTTTSKQVQTKFSDKLNRSDIPVSIEISLKPGDKALPMDQYHKSNEKEILLDRGVKFKVVSVRDGKNGRKIKMELASLDPADSF